ncbi:hypothetical protein GCM10009858_01290 [Terrabacter carboxydivorans]|uniref:Uncharacterized protein n=1 Tax=Terrabacter carboxydivorans TaxID=619730 RepID=A0ABN3KND2_9MICO
MDPVDEVAGVEQVGLAGPGTAAAHVHPGDSPAGRSDDDGDARQPAGLVAGAVPDTQAGDVDEGVGRSRPGSLDGSAHCGSRRSNSMSRPGELKPSRS